MNNSGLKLKKDPESRGFRRVNVTLKGALRIPGLGVEMIRTKNISEGGVALTTLAPCAIDVGKEVQLHLNGVVSNEESARLQAYQMKVVHTESNFIGLTFI